MARVVVRIARQALIAGLVVVVAVAGAVSGVLFVYAADLPQVSALDDYAPSTISRVLAKDGRVVGEFAVERRVVVGYDEVSPLLRQAILASEDEGFERHVGPSVPRIAVALLKDIVERRKAAGASTLTQQLARNLFLTLEKTWERKIKEALLAIQIEKRYTKREIFTLYANQIYFGHGAYGVEAASRLYFGKPAKALALEEAALIAGIIQSPNRQSPYVDPARALRRRNYALSRMADVGYLTRAQAEAAMKRPVTTVGLPVSGGALAPYFVEDVRKDLEAHYGAKRLYEHGLTIRTSLDLRLQDAAQRALLDGLRRLDKRRGLRPAPRNVLAEGEAIEGVQFPRWRQPVTPGDVVPAVVAGVEPSRLRLRVGEQEAEIPREGFAWTGRAGAAAVARRGDVVELRVLARDDRRGLLVGSLEQEPLVEGAVLALDNHTGHVLALVGGYSFERSQFNRATQAYRQLGSTFKAVVYAAAIDRGFTPASILVDLPVSFPGGAGRPPYAPLNYDRRWEGPITLRRALEQSRNVPAVRVVDQLGPAQVVAYARRFGFEGRMEPYLSIALGSAEATLLEVTSAFSVFPGQGIRMRPRLVSRVEDRQGNVLEENRPEPTDALRADTAYVMTSLLAGVIRRGTAARAATLDWPLGGKTGTTDDFTDAWFVGFDPDITLGVWVGLDQKRPLGPGESGATAALPVWMDVMRAWIGGRTEAPAFAPPGNIVFASVDRVTGAPVEAGTSGAFTEVFIAGTNPGTGGGP